LPRVLKIIIQLFRYERSLDVLSRAHDAGLVTKSNLILGLGEEPDEVRDAMEDLRAAGCEILTITQYLRPSPRHHPVQRWVHPEEFVAHARAGAQLGFVAVMAGPLVRSSYRAGQLYAQAITRRGDQVPEHLAHLAEASLATQEASRLLESSPALARSGA
ncbi:MAG: lipoyl synthase, partial [Actinomycetota bacterium]|nr:lipoyl synthase [Actinomycetota bacterium]